MNKTSKTLRVLPALLLASSFGLGMSAQAQSVGVGTGAGVGVNAGNSGVGVGVNTGVNANIDSQTRDRAQQGARNSGGAPGKRDGVGGSAMASPSANVRANTGGTGMSAESRASVRAAADAKMQKPGNGVGGSAPNSPSANVGAGVNAGAANAAGTAATSMEDRAQVRAGANAKMQKPGNGVGGSAPNSPSANVGVGATGGSSAGTTVR